MTKTWTTVFALFVACATSFTHAQDVQPDLQAAQGKITMCIGCHGIPGYQASFPQVHKVPKISGQSAAYIAAALDAYRKGERQHPSMRGIAQSMSDQDIADVAAYYEAHHPPASSKTASAPPENVAALLEKGACMACHGADFSMPVDPRYPKIAGQHADYLYATLKAYKTMHTPLIGRSNPIMVPIAQQFTNQELKLLANYIGSLPGDIATVPQAKFR